MIIGKRENSEIIVFYILPKYKYISKHFPIIGHIM